MADVIVQGDWPVVNALKGADKELHGKVRTVIEKTANRMAVEARSGHERGSQPHARYRFENQTGNLHNSVFPGGPDAHPMQFEETGKDEIVGLFGVLPTAAAVMEYAPFVESRYPFVWPAAHSQSERFVSDLAKLRVTGGIE